MCEHGSGFPAHKCGPGQPKRNIEAMDSGVGTARPVCATVAMFARPLAHLLVDTGAQEHGHQQTKNLVILNMILE